MNLRIFFAAQLKEKNQKQRKGNCTANKKKVAHPTNNWRVYTNKKSIP